MLEPVQQVHGRSFHGFVQAVWVCASCLLLSWIQLIFSDVTRYKRCFFWVFFLMDQKPLKPINVHLFQIKSYDPLFGETIVPY